MMNYFNNEFPVINSVVSYLKNKFPDNNFHQQLSNNYEKTLCNVVDILIKNKETKDAQLINNMILRFNEKNIFAIRNMLTFPSDNDKKYIFFGLKYIIN